jgi:predicted alpha/beta-hydrolase family hydrolase
VHLEATEQPGGPVFIGGKSMGGRVASLHVDELAAG